MQAVAAYRHEPIHRRLEKFGKRESMVHLDVLVLTYHLARICRGSILEIGAFRGGTTVAAAWGVRDAREAKKLITIEPGGSLRKHRLATRNILGSLNAISPGKAWPNESQSWRAIPLSPRLSPPFIAPWMLIKWVSSSWTRMPIANAT